MNDREPEEHDDINARCVCGAPIDDPAEEWCGRCRGEDADSVHEKRGERRRPRVKKGRPLLGNQPKYLAQAINPGLRSRQRKDKVQVYAGHTVIASAENGTLAWAAAYEKLTTSS